MGDMFRSEEMVLAQLFIQPETAYFTVSELGESGIVQFRDLNEDVHLLQRKFINEVRRCDEMDRQLRYIEDEIKKDCFPVTDQADLPKAPNPREIIDLEAHLEKTEIDVQALSSSFTTLKSTFLELVEFKHVLEKTQPFFEDNEVLDSAQKLLQGEESSAGTSERLGYITGVINRVKIHSFERMLWRVSKGNVFIKQVEIEEPLEEPSTGNEINKTVFIAFCQGEQLHARLKKVCSGFHASLYECPDSYKERRDMLKSINTKLEDLKSVLNQTKDHRQRVLITVAKELQNWSVMVKKMKAIYYTLNLFNVDVTKKCLIGECWIPTKDLATVQQALQEGSKACGSSIPSFLNVIETKEIPPTFNRVNRFTRGFQTLIDSYGVASYREVNPALYTIITFPFLFAVMFGDIGHAIIMGLFGGYLVWNEKKIMSKKSDSEIFNIFFAGRYIILLMGVFSVYTGIIYNDFFSKSMNIFGTSWMVKANEAEALAVDYWGLDPRFEYTGTPYFMGLDPAWALAENKIIFLNSFKMKLSIIFGVVHMLFGVCVGVVNFTYFKKYSSIVLEFLPQVFLLCFLFLYMVIMTFMKWAIYSCDKDQPIDLGSSCAPSVLIFFIDMMLFKEPDLVENCKQYMYEGQSSIQMVLVFLSLICIPVLLLGKPLYIKFTRRNKQRKAQGHEEEEEEEEPMSEIFIHQAIHTIEYVLSTISHTASYLRLWALSLAHAQLSEILWGKLFNLGLTQTDSFVGAAMIFIFFYVWAGFTVAILVTMEGLSAFLHTLRLHWVEFMSKFYAGEGYLFQPFSFKAIMEAEGSEE